MMLHMVFYLSKINHSKIQKSKKTKNAPNTNIKDFTKIPIEAILIISLI